MNNTGALLKEIAESWGWVGLEPSEVVGENAFGNLMIKDVGGSYWRLCPEDCYCKVVATSKDELDRLSVDQSFLEDWYMDPLVKAAEGTLGPLAAGKKYHFKIPGILGGEYAPANFAMIDQVTQIRFSGHIARQIKDLPDGAQIELRLVQ